MLLNSYTKKAPHWWAAFYTSQAWSQYLSKFCCQAERSWDFSVSDCSILKNSWLELGHCMKTNNYHCGQLQNNLISRETERKLLAPRLRKWEASKNNRDQFCEMPLLSMQQRGWKGLFIFQHYLTAELAGSNRWSWTGKSQVISKNKNNQRYHMLEEM